MKFVTLNGIKGQPVYINIDKIVLVAPAPDGAVVNVGTSANVTVGNDCADVLNRIHDATNVEVGWPGSTLDGVAIYMIDFEN